MAIRAVLSESWARQVQKLANDFTVLELDIKKRGKYGNSEEVYSIATRLGDLNRNTHSLWAEMKKGLNLKD